MCDVTDEEPPEELLCGVCLLPPLLEPVVIPSPTTCAARHVFCADCIGKSFLVQMDAHARSASAPAAMHQTVSQKQAGAMRFCCPLDRQDVSSIVVDVQTAKDSSLHCILVYRSGCEIDHSQKQRQPEQTSGDEARPLVADELVYVHVNPQQLPHYQPSKETSRSENGNHESGQCDWGSGVTFSLQRPDAQRLSALQALTVSCPNSGCPFQHQPLSFYRQTRHWAHCLFEKVPCPVEGCRQGPFPKAALHDHMLANLVEHAALERNARELLRTESRLLGNELSAAKAALYQSTNDIAALQHTVSALLTRHKAERHKMEDTIAQLQQERLLLWNCYAGRQNADGRSGDEGGRDSIRSLSNSRPSTPRDEAVASSPQQEALVRTRPGYPGATVPLLFTPPTATTANIPVEGLNTHGVPSLAWNTTLIREGVFEQMMSRDANTTANRASSSSPTIWLQRLWSGRGWGSCTAALPLFIPSFVSVVSDTSSSFSPAVLWRSPIIEYSFSLSEGPPADAESEKAPKVPPMDLAKFGTMVGLTTCQDGQLLQGKNLGMLPGSVALQSSGFPWSTSAGGSYQLDGVVQIARAATTSDRDDEAPLAFGVTDQVYLWVEVLQCARGEGGCRGSVDSSSHPPTRARVMCSTSRRMYAVSSPSPHEFKAALLAFGVPLAWIDCGISQSFSDSPSQTILAGRGLGQALFPGISTCVPGLSTSVRFFPI